MQIDPFVMVITSFKVSPRYECRCGNEANWRVPCLLSPYLWKHLR